MFRTKALNTLWLVLALALLPTAASAQGLSAVSTASCDVLYAELDALLDAQGVYSMRLVQRSSEYRSITQSLEALRPVPVPYAGEDLSNVPLEQATGLRPTTRTVTRTEAAPSYATAIGAFALGGLLIYSGAVAMQEDSTFGSDSEGGGTENLILGGLLVAGGFAALANTRTVREQVPDQAAIQYNRSLRARVAEANERIRDENEERARKREERTQANAANAEVEAERARLEAERAAYEATSRRLYEDTIARLSEQGNRRCVSELEANGAIVTFEGRLATVYLFTRPLNRDGGVLPDATSIGGLGFSVQELRLRDPLGILGAVTEPRTVTLLEAAALPFTGVDPDVAYVTRVPLTLENDPIDVDDLSVAGELTAEQDGRTSSATFDFGVSVVGP